MLLDLRRAYRLKRAPADMQSDGSACDPLLREPLQAALWKQQPYLPREFDHAILLRVASMDHSFLPRVLPVRDPYGQTLGAAVLLQDVTRFRLLDQVKNDLVATANAIRKPRLALNAR